MTTSMGRAYLAGLEAGERNALLAELASDLGVKAPGSSKAAEKAVAEFREHGFCVSAGEWRKDIHGVAAPIRTSGGGRLYVVNLGGPAYLLPEKVLRDELGPRVAEVARKVERAMSPQTSPLPITPRRAA
jgi:DNA-binding IclR family transcriptional regulator